MTAGTSDGTGKRSFMDKLLNTVERVGNKVPHPVLMFFYLMIGVILLSAIWRSWASASPNRSPCRFPMEVTPDFYEDVSEYTLSGVGSEDVDFVIQEQTIAINSLLSIEGIRFLFTSFVPNFPGLRCTGRHAHRHDGRGRSRGGRTAGGVDPQAGARSPRAR
jgi:aminobenzoyl-glutamate transport protein